MLIRSVLSETTGGPKGDLMALNFARTDGSASEHGLGRVGWTSGTGERAETPNGRGIHVQPDRAAHAVSIQTAEIRGEPN